MENRILVTGATGTIGKSLVRLLKDQGANFVAGSRDPQKAREVLGISQEQGVHFDLNDPQTFDRATEGVSKVFLLGPPLTFHLEGTLKRFIDFLGGQNIKRIVYLSALGCESLTGELGFHAQVQQYLKAHDFDFTILQPWFFAQNFKNYEFDNITERKITFVVAGEGKVGFVDTEDVARVAATVLTEAGHQGQTYRLTGPELLSYHQAAHLLSGVVGKPIHYPNPSEAAYREALAAAGAPPFVADYMIQVYGMIRNGEVNLLTDDIESVTGRKPTGLEAVLERDFQGVTAG